MSWNSTSFSKRQARTRAASADVGDPNTFTGIFSIGAPVDLPQLKSFCQKKQTTFVVLGVADVCVQIWLL